MTLEEERLRITSIEVRLPANLRFDTMKIDKKFSLLVEEYEQEQKLNKERE